MADLKAVVDTIEKAFKGSKMPRAPLELAPMSIDANSVIEHFLGRSREDVESAGFLPGLHMEDYSYMTPMAVEYYLPPVLRIMLRQPWDDDLWLYLHSYLRPGKNGELWWNLKELSQRQLLAIGMWALYLQEQWSTSPSDYLDPAESKALSESYARLARGK